MVFAHVWSVLQLAALGTLTRTVRVRTLLLAIAVGLYTCSIAAVALQCAWTRLVGSLAGAQLYAVVSVASYTLDPFIEELVKVLPVAILLVLIRTVREQWSFTDCVLVGAASGSGFGLAENLFRYSGAVRHAVPTSEGWSVAVNITPPAIPSLWTTLTSWLPNGTAQDISFVGSPNQYNAHLEWSALGGLAVALLFLGRGRASRWAAGALFLFVGLDHAAVNATIHGVSGLLALVAAPFNALRNVLWLMPVAALVGAAWLDRNRQRVVATPDLALTIERHSRWRGLGTLRAALSRPPWSIFWLDGLTRLRRAYAIASDTESNSAPGLRQYILSLRDRIQSCLAGTTSVGRGPGWSLVRGAFRGFFRSPRRIAWLVLMLPSVAWLVLGGYPNTAWLQAALAEPLPWIIVRVASFFGLAWLGTQLTIGLRAWWREARSPVADLLAGSALHLMSGSGAFVMGAYALFLAITGSAPSDHVLNNFHVLEAIAAAPVIGTMLTAVAALMLSPRHPGAMVDAGPVLGEGRPATRGAAPGTMPSAVNAGMPPVTESSETEPGFVKVFAAVTDAQQAISSEVDLVGQASKAIETDNFALRTQTPGFNLPDLGAEFEGGIDVFDGLAAEAAAADEFFNKQAQALPLVSRLLDSGGVGAINLAFADMTKEIPIVGVVDGALNLLDHSGVVPGAAGYSPSGNLATSVRATTTVLDGLARWNSDAMVVFQNESLAGKNGPLFEFLARVGEQGGAMSQLQLDYAGHTAAGGQLPFASGLGGAIP
jgi:hypothetical protein